MQALKQLASVMEHPLAYRVWQAPFAGAKFAPILEHNDMSTVRRVLDVGCGPGTNAPLFSRADYLGLDINPKYIETARRRFGRRFEVADVRTYEADPDARFDFILVNSLLHHIDTENVYHILRQLEKNLTGDGHVHILDLVMPEEPCIAQTLALSDRGDHARSYETWSRIFGDCFEKVVCQPYGVGAGGVTLWNMVYFKGRRRS